jgi:DNA polymerase-1
MPIQAGAQEIMKIAMADLTPVYQQWKREGRIVRPIMQIHDDLLWEVEDSMAHEAYVICRGMMENSVRLSVPVKVDGKIGSVWGQMKEIKEE